MADMHFKANLLPNTNLGYSLGSSEEKWKINNLDGNVIPYVVGTGTTAGTWLGSIDGITAYYDGLLFLYKSPVAGASTTTLNINNLGAKTVYINGTTKLTTHFPANQPILLVYSTSQNSGCWMVVDNYWANTNTLQRTFKSSASVEVPIMGAATTATTAAATAIDPTTYQDAYGVIPLTTASRATINPNTGKVTIPGGIQIDAILAPTISEGTTYGTGEEGQVLLTNGSTIYWGSAAPTITEDDVSGWGFTKTTGTVYSIATSTGITGGTITTAGTIGLAAATTSTIGGVILSNSSGTAIGTAAIGTSTAVARADHVHSIALATGDSSGQVKIAGTNVSVKGLGTAAYTASTNYATSGHTHGNITNAGAIGSTANYSVVTTTSGKLTAASMEVSSPTASGTAIAFIDTVSQSSSGKISATKKNIQTASTTVDGIMTSAMVTKLNGITSGATSNTGTVTSITLTQGTGITISDSGTAITTSGTRTISLNTATTATIGGVTLSNSVGSTIDSTATTGISTAVARADHKHKGVTSINGQDGVVTLANLTIGTKTYSGTSAVTIEATDLGLTGAMTFIGVTTTNLSENSTATTLTIVTNSGTTTTSNPQQGWVVLDQNDNEEYIWSNGSWQSMGFASSYALKTHIHGYIGNNGALTSSISNVNSHSIVIADGNGTIINSPITFNDDTASEATYLSGNGSWGGIATTSNAGLVSSALYTSIENALNSNISTSGNGISLTGSTDTFGTTSGARVLRNTGVHSVTTSGNYLVVTTNGTTANVTVPYATKAEQDADGRVISSTYVLKSGDTMTGHLVIATSTPTLRVKDTSNNDLSAYLYVGSNHMDHGVYSNGYAPTSSTFTSGPGWIIRRGSDGEAHSSFKIYGAVWNDYAEYRKTLIPIEPGRVVQEGGDGALIPVNERLVRGCEIVSDTFGFAIGQTEDCKTPIAASGRVLAYPYEPIEDFASHIGWPVCSGPEGTVSIMTEEEEEKYPSRIIGTISEIPNYEEWGSGKVKVNGRVWIRIR